MITDYFCVEEDGPSTSQKKEPEQSPVGLLKTTVLKAQVLKTQVTLLKTQVLKTQVQVVTMRPNTLLGITANGRGTILGYKWYVMQKVL